MTSVGKMIKLMFFLSLGFIALLVFTNPVMKFFHQGVSWEVADQFGKLF